MESNPWPAEILAFIKRYAAQRGYPPTVREIAQGCGIASSSSVEYYLKHLERAGHIRREPGRSRTIVAVDQW